MAVPSYPIYTMTNGEITDGMKSYQNGKESSSNRYGYDSNSYITYTLCIPFKTGATGANKFNFSITNAVYSLNYSNATPDGKTAFAITEAGDTTYINYTGNGDGIVAYAPNSNIGSRFYDINGEIEKTLKPNTEYVLWIFAKNNTQFSTCALSEYYNQNSQAISGYPMTITLVCSGVGGGVISILVADSWKSAIPYVYTNGTWQQAIPYVYTENNWKLCT